MKKIILTALAITLTLGNMWAENNPKADEKAVVTAGNARFTVLTDRLIRMEWSENGIFEDNATLAIVNRNLPVPPFKVNKTSKKVVIKTDALTLTYKIDGKFTKDNLSVVFSMVPVGETKARKVTWTPGADESGNLMGTVRTLDGCKGWEQINYKDPYEKGLLSKDGWAIVDESARHIIVAEDTEWKGWVASRPSGERQDLYIFAYGHDYTAALADYTKVAGRIPMPPKYMFGYWWSRYWQYSDFEFVNLAKEIQGHNIPIDVMVIDMDWHETFGLTRRNARSDEFGQRIGWTGYTWVKELFPNPTNFLTELHNLNLKTSLNLHPASGIQPYEESYERFRSDYLSRTQDYDGPKNYVYGSEPYKYAGPDPAVGKEGANAPVPFRIDQKEWTEAYFNSVIHPLERQGVDFWWLDWQQWKESKYTEGLSNTFWLNYCFFNDKVRQSASQGIHAPRPVIYHRWGGLGSHRYQIGFSGDSYARWSVLKFLPYFTATSSNVGYGYWGHDIGGHMHDKNVHQTDPEMLTRWLQYAVFTPIYKTHCTKNAEIERRIWAFPDHYPMMKDAIRLRYDLSPYIYDAAREAYDTGVSMCRPLYYAHPQEVEAYEWQEEFFFGNNILATAICEPMDAAGFSPRSIWFPTGSDWYDMATGKMYAGGSVVDLKYTIEENPWYVKAGAIIPMADENITNLQEASNVLKILVAPGDGESTYTHYEDDGASQAYDTEFATTLITKTSSAEALTLKIAARKGSYKGIDPLRNVKVILEGVYAPKSVRVNGKVVEYKRNSASAPAYWTYDGTSLSAIVVLGESSADKELTVEVEYDGTLDRELLRGKKGMIRRMMAFTPAMKLEQAAKVDPYPLLPKGFMAIAGAGSKITENPAAAPEYLKEINPEAMVEEIRAVGKFPEELLLKLQHLCE